MSSISSRYIHGIPTVLHTASGSELVAWAPSIKARKMREGQEIFIEESYDMQQALSLILILGRSLEVT
jgi:hypothetical protein